MQIKKYELATRMGLSFESVQYLERMEHEYQAIAWQRKSEYLQMRLKYMTLRRFVSCGF